MTRSLQVRLYVVASLAVLAACSPTLRDSLDLPDDAATARDRAASDGRSSDAEPASDAGVVMDGPDPMEDILVMLDIHLGGDNPLVEDAGTVGIDRGMRDAGVDRGGSLDAAPTDRAPPPSDGSPLPNLRPVVQNPQFQTRTFAASSCEVMEGCTVPGERRLLRFDLLTPNVGRGNLYLGPPTMAGRPLGMFEYGTCHRHYHLRGYADYRLVDMAGREVGRGHKQSFCLLDSGRYMGMGTDLPAAARYTCGNQGIHAGWYDAYSRSLDCQYVDITGVPPGTYRIRARINIERVVAESDYDDNEVFYTVTVPASDPTGGDPTAACRGSDMGLDRDCGWTNEGARTCTPGATVAVGCNAGCTPPIGRCSGDPMIRICDGMAACPAARAIVQNDDSCAPMGGRNVCSSLSFRCPSSGRYTILTGAYAAGGSYECHLEAR